MGTSGETVNEQWPRHTDRREGEKKQWGEPAVLDDVSEKQDMRLQQYGGGDKVWTLAGPAFHFASQEGERKC